MLKIQEKFIRQIEKGEGTTPFLFLSKNLELLHNEVTTIAKWLLQHYNVPCVELSKFEDTGESIKIAEIKEFIKSGELMSPYRVKIFIIENISRMTITSCNSCLKFFEEPWIQNIIFLTNASESQVLDTILSRVQIIDLWFWKQKHENTFYISLIEGYVQKKSIEIFSYFFRNKLEKEEYIHFLQSLIVYAQQKSVYFNFLSELEEDITLISTNNVNPKSVVDKYLLQL